MPCSPRQGNTQTDEATVTKQSRRAVWKAAPHSHFLMSAFSSEPCSLPAGRRQPFKGTHQVRGTLQTLTRISPRENKVLSNKLLLLGIILKSANLGMQGPHSRGRKLKTSVQGAQAGTGMHTSSNSVRIIRVFPQMLIKSRVFH